MGASRGVGVEPQRARRDCGAAAECVDRHQVQTARARLHQGTGSADAVEQSQVVGAVKGQDAVIGHRAAAQGSAGAARTHLQAAAADGGGAAVGVVARQVHLARATFLQRGACTRYHAADQASAGVGEVNGGVVGDADVAGRQVLRVHAQAGQGRVTTDGARQAHVARAMGLQRQGFSAIDGGGDAVGADAAVVGGGQRQVVGERDGAAETLVAAGGDVAAQAGGTADRQTPGVDRPGLGGVELCVDGHAAQGLCTTHGAVEFHGARVVGGAGHADGEGIPEFVAAAVPGQLGEGFVETDRAVGFAPTALAGAVDATVVELKGAVARGLHQVAAAVITRPCAVQSRMRNDVKVLVELITATVHADDRKRQVFDRLAKGQGLGARELQGNHVVTGGSILHLGAGVG